MAHVNDESVIRWVCAESTVTEGGEERPKVLAVVGLSDNTSRPAYGVSASMQKMGYRVVPVNPTKEGEILGERVYKSLREIPFPVDVVQVFRAPEYVMGIFRDLQEMAHKPEVFWLQEEVINQEAADASIAYGVPVVMDRCLWKEARRVRAEQKQ